MTSPTGTLVYVHGASDRRASVEHHVVMIERGLATAGLPLAVVAAQWGEEAGARLERIDDALPLPSTVAGATRRQMPAATPPDSALRALVSDGPMTELLRLAAAGTPGEATPARRAADHTRREADQLLDVCREVGQPGERLVRSDGSQPLLAEACRTAAAEVAASPEYAAAHASGVAEGELVAAVGRAVAASVASETAEPLEMVGAIQLRIAEAVVGAAAAALLAGYLGIDVGPGLKRWATDVLLPHRARLMRDAALGPADILLYQHDGAQIRAIVARALDEARTEGGPLVALGNSLGGIILVDLLARPDAPKPDLLVTIGSQAPLLATFDALRLGGEQGQRPFQPWLNIYDRRDLLGFVAGRVWPEETGILDREVDLGVGFPDAHGATYLASAQVYQRIGEHPALAGVVGDGDGATAVRRFSIRIGPRSRLLLRLLFGVTEENAFVELGDELDAHFGWFRLRTPLSNVRSWRIEGPWSWLTAIGVRRSIRHGDVTFGGNHKGGVRLDFIERVPWYLFRVPALYVAVADLEGFGRALTGRGIPGEDARSAPGPLGT